MELISGGFHVCLVEAGEVRCFGNNDHGQIGDGTTKRRPAPTPLAGLSEVIQVAGVSGAVGIVASLGTCAWLDDGTVRCWGAPAGE